MTRDQIIERCARTIAEAMGDDPDKIAPLPSSDYYDAAIAIVDLFGPTELEVRRMAGKHIKAKARCPDGEYVFWRDGSATTPGGSHLGNFSDEAAFVAAVQAHYEEQHWKRTRIWEDE